jgi:hypothetical protein
MKKREPSTSIAENENSESHYGGECGHTSTMKMRVKSEYPSNYTQKLTLKKIKI